METSLLVSMLESFIFVPCCVLVHDEVEGIFIREVFVDEASLFNESDLDDSSEVVVFGLRVGGEVDEGRFGFRGEVEC